MAKDMSLTYAMGVVGLAGALKAFSSMKENIKDVEDATRDLAKAQKKLENLDKMKENFTNINKEYAIAVKQLSKLKDEYNKTGKGNVEFAKKVKDAEKYVDKLNKQKERQAHVFKAARSELEKEGITLKNYKQKLNDVNNALKKEIELKSKLEKAKSIESTLGDISKKGTEQIKTGLAIGTALAVPIKLYMDLEESQADLRKILGKEAEKYYAYLAEISKHNPLSQVEINEIAGSLAQSGIKGDDIVAYTEMAGKMKVAFDITTDEAGQFLAKTKEQLNLSKDDLYSYMDTINMLSNHYAVSAAQLSDVSSRTAGFAKTINLSKEANMAFASSLISSNINAEQTSTILSKLYAELSQGANTKAKAAALDYLGFNSDLINEEMAKDAEGTILKVLARIKNAQGKDKSALITDIFGSHASVLNGISVLSENLDGVKEKLNQAKQAVSENETVNAEYEERINTLTQQLKILKNTFVGVLMDIGKSVGPELKETFETFKNWGLSLGNFVKENPKLVASIFKIVAGIAMFNLGMGGFNKLVAPLGKIGLWFFKLSAYSQKGGLIFGLKKMFPLTTKFLGLIKAVGLALKTFIVANPLVALIVAVVAVIVMFVYLYKKVEWFRDGVNKIFGGWIQSFKGVWQIIIGIFTLNFDLIKEGFKNLISGLTKIWEGLTGIISKTWDKITGFFKKTKDETKEIKDLADNSKNVSPTIYENWTGTNYFTGGLTTLAEKGPELIQINNNSYLANSPTMANLPKGSRILNNSQTRRSLTSAVGTLKNKLSSIGNTSNKTIVGGDTITIQIIGAERNSKDIAREVKRVLEEFKNKKDRTVIA